MTRRTRAGCEVWRNATNSEGYPVLRLGAHVVYAQRLAWEQAGRPLEPGERLWLTCGNRRCCNPDHHETTSQRRERLLGERRREE